MNKNFISTFFKGFASTTFGTAFQIAFHFISVMLLARYIPKETLGIYFLGSAVVQFLVMVSGLGLDLTMVKFISGADESEKNTYFASSFILRVGAISIGSLLFLFFGKLILPTVDQGLISYVAVLTVMFVLTSIKDFLLRLLQGLSKFQGYAIAQIISAIARAILIIVLSKGLSLSLLFFIEIIVLIPALLVQVYVLRTFLLNLILKDINFETIRNLFQFGFPLYLNDILTYVMNRGPVLLIGFFLASGSVASYEIASKIPQGFGRLFTSFILVYFPSQSALFSDGDKNDGIKFMNDTLVLMSSAIAFLVLISFYFRDIIVQIIFSQEYIEVSIAFVLLMLSFYLRAISNILGYSTVSAGYSSAPVITNVIATTINIVSAVFFIQTFGYIGAVFSIILMNLISQVIYVLLLRRIEIKANFREYLKPLLYLVIFAGGYILLVDIHNYFIASVFLVGYVGLCWVTIKQVRTFLTSSFELIATRIKLKNPA